MSNESKSDEFVGDTEPSPTLRESRLVRLGAAISSSAEGTLNVAGS